MNAHAVGWLVFLGLIKSFYGQQKLFSLEPTELMKEATEGSCVHIKCHIHSSVYVDDAYWFWMKDGQYDEKNKTFNATFVYRSNGSDTSPDFVNRVKYIGSRPEDWQHASYKSEKHCDILICDLKESDSGKYAFRFVGRSKQELIKWITNPEMTLRVKKNECPITFEQPPVTTENQRVTLTCSTNTSCPSNLEISPSINDALKQVRTANIKDTTYSFITTWRDDGKVFSCQTNPSQEWSLIRNVTITVEYAPRDVEVKGSRSDVKEGDSVTLTCSAKGQPDPKLTWYRGRVFQHSGANWTISSIQAAQTGSYHCEAVNEKGNASSRNISIDVKYAPDVELQISQEAKWNVDRVQEGEKVTFTCHVKRSKPLPKTTSFTWYKNGNRLSINNQYYKWSQWQVANVTPEDRGKYRCESKNTVGTGTSQTLELHVLYGPRNTRISTQGIDNGQVSVNGFVKLTCETDADPTPWYSWYSRTQTGASLKHQGFNQNELVFESVQRADEACYTCNATNSIKAGGASQPQCIRVRFPPTKVSLSMPAEVTEDQEVSITCAAESFPPSSFTLTLASSHPSLPLARSRPSTGWSLSLPFNGRNSASHRFKATWTDAGSYSCSAANSEGTARNASKKLVVKFAPKEVKVKANPDFVVKENTALKLDCLANAHPELTSVSWTKTTDMDDGAEETNTRTFSVPSAGPSDSGWYHCEATNVIGRTRSPKVKVTVKYGPKFANVVEGETRQLPDGTSSTLLSCVTRCFPPVQRYLWYMKTEDETGDIFVSEGQNITRSSRQPGKYYCTVANELGQRKSETIKVFENKIPKPLTFAMLFCLILLVAFLIFLVYRQRRKKSVRGGTTNTQSCCGFTGRGNTSRSRNLLNAAASAEPFRSRDDLLPNQLPQDRTPASNITSVYCTVNLPKGQQAPPAQKPARQRGRPTEEDSVNYASLHFENKQKKPEEDAVYAKVSKPMPNTPNKSGDQQDYENAAYAARPPHSSDYDSNDTSEDEVEISYTQVNFKLKPGHQRARRDSDTSEEETQYSQVKI